MPRCEAAGEVQEAPDPDGEIGLGEDRTGERERILVRSVESVGHRNLDETMMMGHSEPGSSCTRWTELSNAVKSTTDPGVKRAPTPGRISLMRNVETPMGSAESGGRLTVRKAQLPSGNRKGQKANAGSRKARGNHNPPDRAIWSDPKGC